MRKFQLALAGLVLVVGAWPASAQFWGRGPVPSSGACFYQDADFEGRYFCVPVGRTLDRVPRGTNDEISSIRIFGNAEVTVFRADDMRGDSRRFSSSIRNLKYVGFNDRISSVAVDRRGGGGNWGGAYGGGSYGGGYGGGYGGDSGRHGGWGGAYGGGSSGGRHDDRGRYSYQEAENMVRQAYRRVFKRDPDPAARSWVNEVMKNGWSQRQLEDALRNTPEGRQQPF